MLSEYISAWLATFESKTEYENAEFLSDLYFEHPDLVRYYVPYIENWLGYRGIENMEYHEIISVLSRLQRGYFNDHMDTN